MNIFAILASVHLNLCLNESQDDSKEEYLAAQVAIRIDGIRSLIESHGEIPELVGENMIYLIYFVHIIEYIRTGQLIKVYKFCR